jgi:MFS family permease
VRPALTPGGMSRRRAWLVVVVIGWTFTVATGLGFYALPLYLNSLVSSRGFALTTVSYAVSAFFLVSAVVNVPLGRLVRRVQPRWIMLGGSVVSGLSLLMLGRVDAVWQLYLVFTVFGCGFSASSYLPGTAVIVALFDQGRARALAVALTGGSVGGVVVAPLLTRILDARGLTGTAAWLGLAYVILAGLPVVLFVRGRLAAPPASRDEAAAGAGAGAGAAAGPGAGAADVAPGVSYAQAVRSTAFAVVMVCFAVLMADQVGTQVQIVSIGSAMGVRNAGIAVSIMASATIAGRLIGAFVLSRVPVLGFCSVMGVLQGASFVALAVLPGLFGLVVGTVLFGITIGNLTVLIPLVVLELFGLIDYPRIYAVSQFGASVGAACGPAALAALHSGFGSYRMPLLILAVISGLAAAAVGRLRPPSPGPGQPVGASAASFSAGRTGGASCQGTTPNSGVPTG